MDKVAIKGLRFHAKHGCHPEERKIGGPFEIDIEVSTGFHQAVQSDSIDDAIDYVALMELAEEVMNEPKNLIESVGKTIAERVLERFSLALAVEVTVKKLAPPVGYELSHVSITTFLDRSVNN